MSDDDKPTTPRDRQVNNLEISGWLRCPVEKKHEVYYCQNREVFADPWVAGEMNVLMMLNEMAKDSAKIVHHIVKNPEQAEQLIEQLYEAHYNRIQNRPQVLREVLPPLPMGTPEPLALLTGANDE
jgi:hypothetical protein